MQKAPSPTGSPCLQQDPALTPTPTMPPPEDPSEDHEHSQSPAEQAMKEEFQFLRCPGCKAQARCPKLLPCLHTLCSGCLEAPGLRCPICQAPGAGSEEALDNVFFESLQRRLAVFRQIVDAQAACTRCKESADFWCFECEQLMCHKCFDAHQWFLKHEARPLAELRDSSVREFLDSTRKSNIFCSNTNHRTPAPTNIYCRGCAKPLCCACALLDGDHNHLRCDIGDEIQQRYEELGTMTQALQEQDRVFDSAHAQMRTTIGQLEHARADTEERIRARVRQVVEHVQAQERQLLEAVNARYQRDYQEIAGQLGHLEAVLQRIRSGGALVNKMKLYASDQEVLDMHGFLRKALCHLSQEEPQNQQVQLRTSGFEEFKWCLQDLISCITQRTDAAVARRATPEAASIPRDSLDLEQPSEVQRTQAQALRLSKTPPVAVVQSVPGAHPVPVYAFSMKEGSTYREEVSQTITPMKRKCCHSDCRRKIIKMESTEEDENRLISSSPEQPRPSTSRAISPPHLDGPSSPESPIREKETPPPTSNHVTSDTEKTEERIVVISSSEDSDTENLPSHELEDSSSESSGLQLEGPNSLRALDESLADPQAEDRPLVFFDLKIDNETQKISQLAAVNRESKFRVLIQPGAFSVYSKAVSLEVGLQHFLRFLTSMHRPILACSKLWGPGLPIFFKALEDIDKLWEFQDAISGFLAVLPLIQERIPGASSFKLRNLAKTYLARNMSEQSALAAVLAMRDLCCLLEISPGPQLVQHVYPFSNLQCFASLQPLVQASVLPLPEARLLALHNVSFLELMTAYRSNRQEGLKQYGHYLSLQTSSASVQLTQYLQALSTYLEGLLERHAPARSEGSSTPLSRQSLAKKASQQS
ncbi:protein PML isoform X2 [Peromyscus californicus insignis]|uniref:protein PML isoform X2 n=1 Tax=Peromyscus californicus insignis TaxID=564181 RepID=UPI0022A7B5C6|nr:protein PML isoform X2 [Peromyscus californicus insignis]